MIMESVYKMYIPHILYCADRTLNPRVMDSFRVPYATVANASIITCLTAALRMSYNVYSYMYLTDMFVLDFKLLDYQMRFYNKKRIMNSEEVRFDYIGSLNTSEAKYCTIFPYFKYKAVSVFIGTAPFMLQWYKTIPSCKQTLHRDILCELSLLKNVCTNYKLNSEHISNLVHAVANKVTNSYCGLYR